MGSKSLFSICTLVFFLSLTNSCLARSVKENQREEHECDLLLNRLKRDAGDNAIEDDDVFIENLIKSTLNKEKQKCIDKYHLLELPRQVTSEDGAEETKELRKEVAKLKDLVEVIKDQRYILRTLENRTQKPVQHGSIHSKTNEEQELDNLRIEIKNLQHQFSQNEVPHDDQHNVPHSVHKIELKTESSDRVKDKLDQQQSEINDMKSLLQDVIKQFKSKSVKNDGIEETSKDIGQDRVKDKLDKQQLEITNLKHLLQGVLQEMKVTRSQGQSSVNKASSSKDVGEMLAELNALEKKLALHSDTNKSEVVAMIQNPKEMNEFVGMRPPFAQNLSQPERVQSINRARSAPSSERASEDELDAILSLLTPEKSTSSVDSLLKSLDSDSDTELERRLLTLEKQMKRKKKQQFEEKLKSLEKQLTHSTSIQSKSDDLDLGDNAQLKRLLVKMIKKKNQASESKTLDDDEVLDELKALQKSIKSLSTDDDDLFADLEEKNGNLDVTLEKLITAGGGSSSATSHRRRKLSPGQIKALRRRIMAMKNGMSQSGDYSGSNSGFGESGDDGSNDGLDSYGHEEHQGFNDEYAPQWHITPTSGGHYGSSGFYGPGSGPGPSYHEGFGQYGHDSNGGKAIYGPNKYGHNAHNYGHSEQFYSNPGMYVPTNQFGTPVYQSYPNHYAAYPGIPYSSGNSGFGSGSYDASKYFGSTGYSGSASSASYQGSGGNPGYKPFFPAGQESSASSYNTQQHSGTPGSGQSYQNSQTHTSPASVSDLKNQIYELQGVINSFNKPEYVQKPEDKVVVYNLNKQINDLKGVVNTLQETPYAGQNQGEGGYQPQPTEYAAGNPAPAPVVPNQPYSPVEEHLPQPQPQQQPQTQNQAQAVYASPQGQGQPEVQPHGDYQHPPAARSYDTFRKRRSIDVPSDLKRSRNEEVINTLGALLGEVFNAYDDDDDHVPDPIATGKQRVASHPNMFDDINAKIADVRKQLDHQVQQRLGPHHQFPLNPLRQPQLPQQQQANPLRSNTYNQGYNYDNYGKDHGYEPEKDIKFKFIKDDKKSNKKADVFDKIFDKIIDKIIDKVEKAFPKILEVIFGKFEFTKEYSSDSYGNDYGAQNYGDDYGDHDIAKTFHGMGLFGLLPMFIMKILSKIHLIFSYLQKYKFFKTFLIPAIVLLLAAGGIIFLVWWLQPNEENQYKQISYEQSYPTYHSDYPETTYRQGSAPVKVYQSQYQYPVRTNVKETKYQGFNSIPRNVPQRNLVENNVNPYKYTQVLV